jgi:L-fucose isomerase-like protein
MKLLLMNVKNFIAVCRVVKGLRKVRIGAVGARPGAFNTVRYSEKILQRNGISVTTVDLSEILGNANKLTAEDKSVKEKLDKIHAYTNTGLTPPEQVSANSKA